MTHQQYIQRAAALAEQSISEGGGPFGAVIVKQGIEISTGKNMVTKNRNPTAHAEIVAIQEACRKLDDFKLDGCILYSSCEPCPMCFGAIYWAGLDAVYYAGTRSDAAEAGFDDARIYDELNQERGRRSIPFIELRQENRDPFRTWNKKTDKTRY
ncbi:nucleoside deaminase [Sinobaca sp. H24]|uniref:nucleoside deaminase n=1 Tax=Sinobaca sp. H24 TaxID=2923376 RepID=UPI00207B028C|nr:nucleoside deaminase [Sinobaca sp. H24]